MSYTVILFILCSFANIVYPKYTIQSFELANDMCSELDMHLPTFVKDKDKFKAIIQDKGPIWLNARKFVTNKWLKDFVTIDHEGKIYWLALFFCHLYLL